MLGGEILNIKTFADTPLAYKEMKDQVMHLELRVRELVIYMADSGLHDICAVFHNEVRIKVAHELGIEVLAESIVYIE